MAEHPHGAPEGPTGHLSAEERKLIELWRSMSRAEQISTLCVAQSIADLHQQAHEVVEFPRKPASGGEGTPCCRT